MFKVPPAPFELKRGSLQPINAQPRHLAKAAQLQYDRSSHEPGSHDEVVVPRDVGAPAQPQQTQGFRSRNLSSLEALTSSQEESARKRKKHRRHKRRKESQEDSIVVTSFTAPDGQLSLHIIRDSFAATQTQDDSTKILTPPPTTTTSRKRKENDVFDESRSKKAKRSHADASLSMEEKCTPKIWDKVPLIADKEEERRRRKKEKKTEKKQLKEERKQLRAQQEQRESHEQVEHSNGIVEEDEEIPPTMNVIEHTQPYDNDDFPMHELQSPPPTQAIVARETREEPAGKPARKRRTKHVQIHSSQIPEDEQPISEPPQPSVTAETTTQPEPQSTPKKAKRRGVSGSHLSNEIIVDSSAEEEETLKPLPVTPKSTPKSKKGPKSNKRQKSIQTVEGTPKHEGKFSREEDENIHKFVTSYKEMRGLTDEQLEEEIRTKEGRRALGNEISKSPTWGRDAWQIIRRIGRLYTSLWNAGEKAKGPYSRVEDDKIKEHVEVWFRGKQWTMEKFLAMIERNEGQKKKQRELFDLVGELVGKLPGRDRTSVNRHLVALYADRGVISNHWTPQDDTKLKQLVAKHGQKWTAISNVMGRSPEIVRLRYKDYTFLGENRSLGKWDEAEENELMKIVHSILRDSEWEAEEGFDVDVMSRYVDWGVVSLKMGTRSRLQCRGKWKIWNRLQSFDFGGKMDELESRFEET